LANNNINWTGNRVLDPNAARQMPQPTYTTNPNQMPQPTYPTNPIQQGNAITQQGPPPSTDKGYIPNYLASNIGRNVRAEFIIGTTQYADKTGVLAEVGINYFVLHDVNSRTDVMCDLYSVKFVTILEPLVQPANPLMQA